MMTIKQESPPPAKVTDGIIFYVGVGLAIAISVGSAAFAVVLAVRTWRGIF